LHSFLLITRKDEGRRSKNKGKEMKIKIKITVACSKQKINK